MICQDFYFLLTAQL